MEPIALLDYFVKIITYQNSFFKKVSFFEAIPEFQAINLIAVGATLASGAQTTKQMITNLDLWDNEFGQWRWIPLDEGAQLRLYVPSGVGKWQLKNIQVGIDRSIVFKDPLLTSTEICTWQDQRPAMEAVNYTAQAINAARVNFWGFRYHTIDPTPDEMGRLNGGIQAYTPVQCAGMAGGGQ
jgi:hypothetical protein